MPFVFLIVGVVMLVTALRGQASNAASLLKNEFSGTTGFVPWALALVILGVLGYIKPIKPITQAFMALVLLVLVISNKGFFAQFNAAIRAPAPVSTPPASTPAAPSTFAPSAQAPTTSSANNPNAYNWVIPGS